MPIKSDLAALGVNTSSPELVLAYIARLPVTRAERIRMLRLWEREEGRFFDPAAFARAVDGIPPT